MTIVSGLPPAVANLPGLPTDRPPTAAAVQARQAEAAGGRTPGAAPKTLLPSAVTGLAGFDRSARLQERRLAAALRAVPADEPAGPQPSFDTTPLEKLRYPPSPLQELAWRMRQQQDDPVGPATAPAVPGVERSQPPEAAVGEADDPTDAADPGDPPDKPNSGDAAARVLTPSGAPAPGGGYEAQTDAVDTAQPAADDSTLNIRR